jgi:uncharacterized membrane protein YfcA
MSLTLGHILLLAAAGALAGAINAAAGGGSLLSFPALVLVGLPALSANVTNTVALSFGYVGGAAGFREELRQDPGRVRRLAVASGAGAVIGVVLIEISSPDTFRALVPWLLLASCLLLAAQPWVARHVADRRRALASRRPTATELAQVAAGAYGAYFGAGMGVMVLALLGMGSTEPLQHLNALKSAIQLAVNAIAAACFIVIAPVSWAAVLVLGPASLVGGRLGASLSKRVPTTILRRVVITLGIAVAVKLLVD